MLRSNFVVVADHVEEHDGHLLAPKEKARTADFKVWMRLQSCLHCKHQVRWQGHSLTCRPCGMSNSCCTFKDGSILELHRMKSAKSAFTIES